MRRASAAPSTSRISPRLAETDGAAIAFCSALPNGAPRPSSFLPSPANTTVTSADSAGLAITSTCINEPPPLTGGDLSIASRKCKTRPPFSSWSDLVRRRRPTFVGGHPRVSLGKKPIAPRKLVDGRAKHDHDDGRLAAMKVACVLLSSLSSGEAPHVREDHHPHHLSARLL